MLPGASSTPPVARAATRAGPELDGARRPGTGEREGIRGVGTHRGDGTLRDEKILITGPAGRIAFPLAQSLVDDNEVWGIARFGDAESRSMVEDVGVITRTVDLLACDIGDLPTDFTYVLHLAADFGEDYDRAMRVNAEATGLLLEHCRAAKAALVMSTVTTYKPHPDPWHPFNEDDPLGDALMPWSAPYSVTKIAQEGVARYCARSFDLPVVITRMGSAYGNHGGLPAMHLEAIAAGEPVRTRWDPMTYSPIHDDDIAAQVESLLGAASVPATIVNWCGDEAVSVQEWVPYLGELLGVESRVEVTTIPGASVGSVGDPARRRSITGPCRVGWRDGFRRMVEHFHPGPTA
jgi:nucleoside-diphosphate-sugar epimerase